MAHVINRTFTYHYDTLRPLSFELLDAIDDGLRKGGVIRRHLKSNIKCS